jgi:hypothetical protein
MARPKGIQQKRNEQKYALPAGVTLKQPQPKIFNKETKLTFCDSEFGEFISTFRAIQQANASTHPEAVKKRRETTNLNKYGSQNVSGVAEFRKKAQETMAAITNEDIFGDDEAPEPASVILKAKVSSVSNTSTETGKSVENLFP